MEEDNFSLEEFEESVIGAALKREAEFLIREQLEGGEEEMSEAEIAKESASLAAELIGLAYKNEIPDWEDIGDMTASRVGKYEGRK